MVKREYTGKYFRITYTLEEEGPHPTVPHDYYDDTYTITAIFQGEGVCYIEGNANKLSPGTIVMMSPEEIRSFRLTQTGCHERLSLYFSDAILSPVWEYELPQIQALRVRTPGSGNAYLPQRYDTGTVMPILEKLRGIVLEGNTQKAPLAHLLILELLFALCDAGDVQGPPTGGIAQDREIAELCKYIKEHLADDLSYKSLQKQFLLSRYQLTDVFRRNTGMTLTEYILCKRLMQSMSLVRGGESIENAAWQAGFHTYSHFYKEFRKHYRMSPRQYFADRKL